MLKGKWKIMILELMLFFITFIMASTIFKDQYLFNWITFNYKFYIMLILLTLIILLFNQKIISIFLSIGITFGLFISDFIGGFILSNNDKKITKIMSAEEIARLNQNPAFIYWIIIIVISLVIALFYKKK